MLEYNKKGLLIEGQLSDTQIQPNSIDLTLADMVQDIIHVTKEEILNFKNKNNNSIFN